MWSCLSVMWCRTNFGQSVRTLRTALTLNCRKHSSPFLRCDGEGGILFALKKVSGASHVILGVTLAISVFSEDPYPEESEKDFVWYCLVCFFWGSIFFCIWILTECWAVQGRVVWTLLHSFCHNFFFTHYSVISFPSSPPSSSCPSLFSFLPEVWLALLLTLILSI